MSLSDLASLGSLVSGVAVLGSLIYLALQLRQTDRNQQALIRHSRSSRTVDLMLARLDPGVANAWRRGLQEPDEISQTELLQFLSLCRAHFHNLEDAFYQHEEGLLNEAAFATALAGAHGMARYPGLRAAWEGIRRNHAGPFADFMAGVVAGGRLGPPGQLPSVDEWRGAYAAERELGLSPALPDAPPTPAG